MKKLLVSIAIILMAMAASAQSPTGLNVGAGFVNNFTSLSDEHYSFTGGFLEVGYNLQLSELSGFYFGVRADAVYNGRIMRVYGSQYAVSEMFTRMWYLDVPVRYSFMMGDNIKFFFDIGPTVNFWLSARSRWDAASTITPGVYGGTINWFDDDYCNRVNLSLGGNIGILAGPVKIYAGYDQGLFSMTKTDKLGYSNIGQLRVGFAYVF